MNRKEFDKYRAALNALIKSMNNKFGKGEVRDIEFIYSISTGHGLMRKYNVKRYIPITQNTGHFETKYAQVWQCNDKPEILFLGRRRRLKW